MQEPRMVSVGMPVHNGGEFIEAALSSLLAQDYPNLEIIISDNASTDSTLSVCAMLAGSDQRVRILSNSHNMGPSHNFRRVLELARGDYFMWAAHDDTWSDNYVSSLVDTLEKTGAALAVGRAVFQSSEEIRRPRPMALEPDSLKPSWQQFLQRNNGDNSHWIYGLFVTNELKFFSDELWALPYVWGGDAVWLWHFSLRRRVAGSSQATKYTFHKPSSFRPRGGLSIIRWQLWFGGALFRSALTSPLSVRERLYAVWYAGVYYVKLLRCEGDWMLVRTWLAAIRDILIQRNRSTTT